ncbi:DUF488 domain-containing protein [Flavobacterium capsici]|uniref:DUF488 family protein n=1 Tax=Flavobacterium capsici TaxID=3075618 RepID=A0AA96F2U3_9FLAO|nr:MULTISPECIES: DUF488 family protein [unclassified Flavobacterium]WNM18831.1 DUF488 family protein [Flavobacterium sp. PMR2A8]WNM22882.1 DUF488 family protein [Flavobacterium sp. PMTSA4]
MEILEKRIYEPFSETDGFRILADRLWPRGVKKEEAKINLWAKEITPTNELRIWYHSNENQYSEFEQKYYTELISNPELDNFINEIKNLEMITLLTAAKNIKISHLPIIKRVIEEKVSKKKSNFYSLGVKFLALSPLINIFKEFK